jgi:ABC-type methionine transport system ATPase subunit
MITNQPGIELVDVRLDNPRGGPPLVDEANMRVTGGERVLIVGAAGVGTSRLVATVLGEVTAGAGRVEVLGRDVARLRRSSLRLLRRRVGIVPQDLCLLEDRSAQLNVVLPLEIDGIPRSISTVRAARVLALLGLEAEAAVPVDQLSMAARQRVAVARALVREPELVIADHPTSAQDAEGGNYRSTTVFMRHHLINGLLDPLALRFVNDESDSDFIRRLRPAAIVGQM